MRPGCGIAPRMSGSSTAPGACYCSVGWTRRTPGCWDLSVGEHLQPGEDYHQAATRGLEEELGIVGLTLTPLGGVRHMRLELPDARIRDYELQQSYQARYDGTIAADPEEVAEVRFVTLAELGEELANRPGDFTPWASQDVEDLSLLEA